METTPAASYAQHTPSWRRKNRSGSNGGSENQHHMSLAPLTTRLPLRHEDYEAINSAAASSASSSYYASASRPHTSYVYGRSAPTTPRLLSHSPPPPTSRPRRQARGASVPYTPELGAIAGSKSNGHDRSSKTAATSPTTARKYHKSNGIFPDTDFLLRVGALIASEARDAKGQGWLVTRASSTTSLSAVEQQPQFRQQPGGSSSAWASRRGSRDYHSYAAGGHHSYGSGSASAPFASPAHSRFASRRQSQADLPGGMGTRILSSEEMRRADKLGLAGDDARAVEDYFSRAAVPTSEDGTPMVPGFVRVDEAREYYSMLDGQTEEDDLTEDEAAVREFMRNRGVLGWLVDKMSGRDDSHTDEEEPAMEEYETNDYEAWKEAERDRQERRSVSLKRLQECTVIPLDCTNDPPPKEDQGVLGDAAWLLKVAAKALFA